MGSIVMLVLVLKSENVVMQSAENAEKIQIQMVSIVSVLSQVLPPMRFNL